MDQYCREPMSAAVIAAATVTAYVYLKSKMKLSILKPLSVTAKIN